ncbi:alpha/beta hydrolase [Ruegeria hyattellae]|uniref:alpha/beta hydrolase n=1 Tax=Ruegeria hyattellae TaxID=3233337 RepID=UPI00355B4AD3
MKNLDLNTHLALAPANGQAYQIASQDGVNLRIGVWTEACPEKGTVFLLPGRADFIEKQGHAISELCAQGFSVCVLEFRGLGLSDRVINDKRAGHVHRFTDYQYDVTAMMAAASDLSLPRPFFLLGNSMGGCVGLRSIIEGIPFAAAAFTSPMWGIQLSAILHLIAPPVTFAARTLGFGHRYAPGKNGKNETLEWSFEENEITGDEEMFAHLQHVNREVDQHWIGGPTIGWLQQALRETKYLAKQPAPITPSIAFGAEHDCLVELAAIEARMRSWSNGSYHLISDARHDLLRAGPDIRSFVLQKISGFFEAHASRGLSAA